MTKSKKYERMRRKQTQEYDRRLLLLLCHITTWDLLWNVRQRKGNHRRHMRWAVQKNPGMAWGWLAVLLTPSPKRHSQPQFFAASTCFLTRDFDRYCTYWTQFVAEASIWNCSHLRHWLKSRELHCDFSIAAHYFDAGSNQQEQTNNNKYGSNDRHWED